MTIVNFFHTSAESFEGGHGISSREEEVWPSSSKTEGSMTMAIFLPSLVKSCSGGHGISSKEEEVCPPSPKKERSMTMVIFLPSSVESCGGGLCHHHVEKNRSALPLLRSRG